MSDTPRKRWNGRAFPILVGCFVALVVIMAWETAESHAGYSWTSDTDSETGAVHAIRIRDGRWRLAVDLRGDIEMTADERGIERMGSGAYLEIEERKRHSRRRLEATPGSAGRPEIAWFVDRRRAEFDAQGREWLAAMMPKIYRVTGLDAEGRVGRLLAAAGVAGVLDEVAKIRGDSIQRLYFEHLLAQAEPDGEDLERMLRSMGREIGSDHEIGKLLAAIPSAALISGGTARAFAGAAGTIGSDHELRKALAAHLERPDFEPAACEPLLAAASTIGSDYEVAELLCTVAEDLDLPLSESYFRLLGTIGTDYEHRRVLSAAVAREDLAGDTVAALLDSSHGIGSDYELARFLIELAAAYPIDEKTRPAFERAAAKIGSSYERERVLAAVSGASTATFAVG